MRYLIQVNAYEDALVVEEGPVESPVRVSRWARRFIRGHRGSAYVWLRPFAGSNWTIAVALTPPPDARFKLRLDDEGVRVFTADGLGSGVGLSIHLRRFPRPKLVAYTGGGAGHDPIGAANG